jgi:hypothetical protein
VPHAAVKNEALDIAAVVAQYQKEVASLKAQLAALSGESTWWGPGLRLAYVVVRTCADVLCSPVANNTLSGSTQLIRMVDCWGRARSWLL